PPPLTDPNRAQRPGDHRNRVDRGEQADEILVVAERDEVEVVDEQDDAVAGVRAERVEQQEPDGPRKAAQVGWHRAIRSSAPLVAPFGWPYYLVCQSSRQAPGVVSLMARCSRGR